LSMTLAQAATKSWTNFSAASSAAYTSAIERSSGWTRRRGQRACRSRTDRWRPCPRRSPRPRHPPRGAHVEQVDEEVVRQGADPVGELTGARAAALAPSRAGRSGPSSPGR
jgi:hypothetical protein